MFINLIKIGLMAGVKSVNQNEFRFRRLKIKRIDAKRIVSYLTNTFFQLSKLEPVL